MTASLPTTQIAPGAVLVTVNGKLRGSRARQLGDHLTDLALEGRARVVLDLRAITFLDSLATIALEEGIDRGLKIHLVVSQTFEFDPFFASKGLERRGLRVHASLEEAVERVRGLVDSGMVLV